VDDYAPPFPPAPTLLEQRAREDRALLPFVRDALGDLRRELKRTDLIQGVRMADTIAKTCIDKINNQR
jgi:hypothetical protein